MNIATVARWNDDDLVRFGEIIGEKIASDLRGEMEILHNIEGKLKNMATKDDIAELKTEIGFINLHIKSLNIDRDDHEMRITRLEQKV